MGLGEVRGELLKRPQPISPLSKWPCSSSCTMLDASADSNSNDALGTLMGLGQCWPTGPAFANPYQPDWRHVGNIPTFFPSKSSSSGSTEVDGTLALNLSLTPGLQLCAACANFPGTSKGQASHS